VRNLTKDLKKNNRFSILEPDPSVCQRAELTEIDCIITPALVFDKKNHRLGYGFGYYDRLIKLLPNAYTIGIGFKEQFYDADLPIDPHDVFLHQVYLF
jgi:5-formyltetrahydrofolate cyclo-ligase